MKLKLNRPSEKMPDEVISNVYFLREDGMLLFGIYIGGFFHSTSPFELKVPTNKVRSWVYESDLSKFLEEQAGDDK